MLKVAKRLIALKKEKTELNKELKNLNDHIAQIEEELSSLFIEGGVSSIGVDGKNVILVEKKSVKCDQSMELIEMLTEKGADVWNKPINITSLTKFVNDNPETSLGDHVTCAEYYTFQVRKK